MLSPFLIEEARDVNFGGGTGFPPPGGPALEDAGFGTTLGVVVGAAEVVVPELGIVGFVNPRGDSGAVDLGELEGEEE